MMISTNQSTVSRLTWTNESEPVWLYLPPGNMEDYKQLEDDLADCTTNSGDTLNDCLEDLAGRQSGDLSLVEID